MFIGIKIKRLAVLSAVLLFLAAAGIIISAAAVKTQRTGSAGAERMLPIIMYHSVCVNPRVAGSPYVITPDKFREDMKYLCEKGYTSVFISEVADFVNSNGDLPEKPVVISFDDGFYNVLSEALPILCEYGMKATVNIVGSYTQKYSEAPDANPEYAYLSWTEIKQLCDSGRIEIGNHSYNMHSNSYRQGCKIMPGETTEHYAAALKEDILRLQGELEKNSGVQAQIFAYPFGAVCGEAQKIIKELGFTAALGCNEHINRLVKNPETLYSLGRINRSSAYSTQRFMEKYGIK